MMTQFDSVGVLEQCTGEAVCNSAAARGDTAPRHILHEKLAVPLACTVSTGSAAAQIKTSTSVWVWASPPRRCVSFRCECASLMVQCSSSRPEHRVKGS